MAIHASRRAQIYHESSVLVLGAGAIGLLCAAMSKVAGSGNVVIADLQQDRVAFATGGKFADVGVTIPLKHGHDMDGKLRIAKETAALACESLNTTTDSRDAFDVVLECTGIEACTQAAIYVSHEHSASSNRL